MLFNESTGRLILEIEPKFLEMVEALFAGQAFAKLGSATDTHHNLCIEYGKETLLDEPIAGLKEIWKNGLVDYY